MNRNINKTARILKLVLVGVLFTAFAQASNYQVDLAQPLSKNEAGALVEKLLSETKVKVKEVFCVKKELTCRTHYVLSDLSGNLVDAFYVKFVAVDRSVVGTGYFFPVKGQVGTYIRFEDFSFDGEVNVNKVVSENPIKIEKTPQGTIKLITGFLSPRLGTTKVTNATIAVDSKGVVLEGLTTDTADPKFSESTRIEYLRTDVTN